MKKWIVDTKYTSKKEQIKYIKEDGENPKDYDIEDFSDVEISAVREDNKHGLKSYGWNDMNAKIILFGRDGEDKCSAEELEQYKEMAQILCDGLNKPKGEKS